jgi:TonB family protein
MSVEFRTPLKIATGLGSAKSGAHHFMALRITSVALIALGLWIVWIALEALHMDYAAARALIASAPIPRHDAPKPPAGSAPVATHIVPPVFPTTWNSASGRVDASFLIASDGSVRDIRIVDNGAGASFTRAAERALRQWQFDPKSLSGDRAVRFEQSFVFDAAGQRHSDKVDSNCVHSTGSLICRPLDDPAPATTLAINGRR